MTFILEARRWRTTSYIITPAATDTLSGSYLSKHRDGYKGVTQLDDFGINACVLGAHYDCYGAGIIGQGIVNVGFLTDGYYFIAVFKEEPDRAFYRSFATHRDVVKGSGRCLDCIASDTHTSTFGYYDGIDSGTFACAGNGTEVAHISDTVKNNNKWQEPLFIQLWYIKSIKHWA